MFHHLCTCIITFYNVPSFVSRALSLSTMFHHLCHVHYHFLQCSIICVTCIITFYNVPSFLPRALSLSTMFIICVTCIITFYNVPSFVSHALLLSTMFHHLCHMQYYFLPLVVICGLDVNIELDMSVCICFMWS